MRWNPDPVTRALQREEEARRLPLAAMFTALAVLLPQVFHLLGLGSMFLPMFLPVLAAALLLPLRLACITAVLSPLLSWMLTGMPPLSPPVLPLLLVELTASACIASTLRRGLRWNMLPALAVTFLIDRILLYVFVESATAWLGVRHPMFGPAVVLTGLPGVILNLVVLPPAVALIERQFPRLQPLPARELRS